jgi:hypothetical protein
MATNTSINTPALVNKGDLLLGKGGSARPGILPASTDGFVLTLDSTQPTGTKWAAVANGGYSAAAITVSPTSGKGDFTTIAAALTAALSGDTIFLLEGTYTENPVLKAGVNLVAWSANGTTPNVIINGKCTFTGTGVVSISGIRLRTNSDNFLAITGSSNSVIYLRGCCKI